MNVHVGLPRLALRFGKGGRLGSAGLKALPTAADEYQQRQKGQVWDSRHGAVAAAAGGVPVKVGPVHDEESSSGGSSGV